MKKIFTLTLAFYFFATAYAFALKKPIIFPKEGQSREQKQQDEAYCRDWSQDETGVDPAYIRAKLEAVTEQLNNQSAYAPSRGRRLLRGAALGAAMGGIDDGIDNNVGKRAVQGVVLSGSRARQDSKQAYKEKQVQSLIAKQQQLLEQYDEYMRAFAVCMDAKGYSVR